MPRLVVRAHCAKRPFQVFECSETAGFGQVAAATNGVCERWVFVLQKSDDGVDGGEIVVAQGNDSFGIVSGRETGDGRWWTVDGRWGTGDGGRWLIEEREEAEEAVF